MTSQPAMQFWTLDGSVLVRQETNRLFSRWNGTSWTPFEAVTETMFQGTPVSEEEALELLKELLAYG